VIDEVIDEDIIGQVRPGQDVGILPRIIRKLLDKRKECKLRMKKATGVEK
jgi:DNA polymerase elongation subunit (family B)